MKIFSHFVFVLLFLIFVLRQGFGLPGLTSNSLSNVGHASLFAQVALVYIHVLALLIVPSFDLRSVTCWRKHIVTHCP